MKIAFIGQKGIPVSQGGVERHVEELAVRLAMRGNDILVYSRSTYKTGNRELPKNIKIITFPSIPIKAWDTILHVMFSSIDILFRKVDVIHYHSMGPAFFMFLPKLFKPSAKIIFTHHSPETQRPQWGAISRFAMKFGEKIGILLADEVIAVSKILSKEIKHEYGRKVNTVPNGVSKSEKRNSGNSLNIPKRYIFTASRLIRSKGLDHLINAFNLISGDYPEYKLLIAGTGTNNDNDEPRLRSLASENKQIEFLGWQSSENMAELFSRATVFVQPSEIEGLPITLLEAALYGVPTLVSDIPEHTSVVEDEATTFKNKSYFDLASKLREILSDLPEYKIKASILSHRVAKQYNWEKIVDQIEQIYRDKSYKNKPTNLMKINFEKTAH